MAINRITHMLELCTTEQTLFPPTDLYNEGWMLRLTLDWFTNHLTRTHTLTISKKEQWYSEALIPSAFLPRYRGDKYAESWTHADGVIGNIKIGKNRSVDLTLLPDASNFIVIEAKMFSKLSSGVTHARYFNQAARSVACMAEVLRRGNRRASEFKRLSFFVIAPQQQIDIGIFNRQMSHDSISKTVKRRVDEYDDSKDSWYKNWFQPTMKYIKINLLSLEELLSYISKLDESSGEKLKDFYKICIEFNKKSP